MLTEEAIERKRESENEKLCVAAAVQGRRTLDQRSKVGKMKTTYLEHKLKSSFETDHHLLFRSISDLSETSEIVVVGAKA